MKQPGTISFIKTLLINYIISTRVTMLTQHNYAILITVWIMWYWDEQDEYYNDKKEQTIQQERKGLNVFQEQNVIAGALEE